jgi:hypothetical protein
VHISKTAQKSARRRQTDWIAIDKYSLDAVNKVGLETEAAAQVLRVDTRVY